ncbi:MAG: 4Fe-4S dicluster domain-containing protein [Rhodobacteraceae bacterium]|nr:4Fe-4S dicluster domain-containing protein [Paracoccaceae bacterium]
MTSKAEIAVEKFLEKTDSEAASFFEACVHCGICAEACQFHLATGDPKYTPTYKLRPMERAYKREKAPFSSLKKMLGLAPKPVTEEELIEWGPLVYDSCNMCARCTLVCPMGIDIAGTISKMRAGYEAAGLAPEGLERSVEFVKKTTSPMGVTIKALSAQIKHQEKATGLKIEVDKQGADYMCTFSSSEIMGYPEVLGAYAKLFDRAGVSWTISSVAYEATNVGVQIGSASLAKEIVTRVVESAEALGVKAVISPECGHAYGAIRFAGPNLMGRQYKFEVVHIIEVIDQLRREGKLPAGKKDARKMTLHDPCQIVRRGGLLKEPRRLLDDSCSNFTEMKYAGKANFCCGGGGGVSANERAEELRTEAFSLKVDQLNGVDGLEAVVVPCANCRSVFEDGLDAYEMDLEVLGLAELVAETLAEPDEKQG